MCYAEVMGRLLRLTVHDMHSQRTQTEEITAVHVVQILYLGLLGPPLAELPRRAGDDSTAVRAVVPTLARALWRHRHLQPEHTSVKSCMTALVLGCWAATMVDKPLPWHSEHASRLACNDLAGLVLTSR